MKKLFLFISLIVTMLGCSVDNGKDSWNDPVIPVSMVGIEAVNIDNAGELPAVSNSPVKKEAYMIGIKWITDNTPSDEDDKFITGTIKEGEHLYSALGDTYSKAIKCNTQFNANIPAGKYVSKYFKEIDKKYLPAGIDEGFVLLVAPDPGEHSFRVEYYIGEELKFFYDTPLINFY
ncbi:MAG: DUF5034 domain-containing protein [Candidatus Azobacteroides sp.]|nr:DUF5034 domain-containing protein [Candidatus Azobacteroides sp.]